jgi:hypothetical protein
MTLEARDLIGGLCTVDVTRRLGNIRGGATAVKSHPWFRGVDWPGVLARRQPGPIVPYLRGAADTRNFDDYEPEKPGRAQYTEDLRGRYEDSFRDF